jgi:hypothetical protein
MIEVILDRCLEELRTRRVTVDECLARYPDDAADLAPLLELALALEGTMDVKPSVEFKAGTRARLARLAAPSPSQHRRFSEYLSPHRAVKTRVM